MNALPSVAPLSLAYTDPETYLVQPHLHLSARFSAPFLPPDAPLQRVTFASVGDPTGPLLILSELNLPERSEHTLLGDKTR